MTRYGLLAIAIGLVCLSIAAVGVAMSLTDPILLPSSPVVIEQTVVSEVRVEVTVTPSATRYPTPESTALPNCAAFWVQKGVCTWPTATQVLPIPTCGPEIPGTKCIREGPVVATITGLPTPSPTVGVP